MSALKVALRKQDARGTTSRDSIGDVVPAPEGLELATKVIQPPCQSGTNVYSIGPWEGS